MACTRSNAWTPMKNAVIKYAKSGSKKRAEHEDGDGDKLIITAGQRENKRNSKNCRVRR